LGAGSYDAASRVYSITGSAAAVSAALDGLDFVAPVISGNQPVTTGFTLVVSDGTATAADTTYVAATVPGGASPARPESRQQVAGILWLWNPSFLPDFGLLPLVSVQKHVESVESVMIGLMRCRFAGAAVDRWEPCALRSEQAALSE